MTTNLISKQTDNMDRQFRDQLINMKNLSCDDIVKTKMKQNHNEIMFFSPQIQKDLKGLRISGEVSHWMVGVKTGRTTLGSSFTQ